MLKYSFRDPNLYFVLYLNICFKDLNLLLIPFSYVLMCTFRASCYSTHLSWGHTPVINWSVWGRRLVVSSSPVRG